MSKPDIEQHLTALGVPHHVAAYVAAQKPLRLPSLSGWGMIAVMMAGFAFGGVWLWPFLEGQLDQNARAAAEDAHALLYHHNFGIGLLIALFGWIGASGVIVGAVPMLSSRLAAGAFYDSVTSAANAPDTLAGRSARWGMERMMERLRDEPDPARYVRRTILPWLRPAVAFTAAIIAIATLVTLRELSAYTLYSIDGYEQRHTFLPSPTQRAWSDASRVEVGCNHVGGDDSSDSPIYEVHFRDGGSTRVSGAFPVAGSWLDQVEVIDEQLVAAGARFEPWTWLGRDPYAPNCLVVYARILGDERYDRFRRLLRVPEQ